eukprot:12817666-Alexandrium_andersonii.AAC.1
MDLHCAGDANVQHRTTRCNGVLWWLAVCGLFSSNHAPSPSTARQVALLPRLSQHLAPSERGADSRSVWGAGPRGVRR